MCRRSFRRFCRRLCPHPRPHPRRGCDEEGGRPLQEGGRALHLRGDSSPGDRRCLVKTPSRPSPAGACCSRKRERGGGGTRRACVAPWSRCWLAESCARWRSESCRRPPQPHFNNFFFFTFEPNPKELLPSMPSSTLISHRDTPQPRRDSSKQAARPARTLSSPPPAQVTCGGRHAVAPTQCISRGGSDTRREVLCFCFDERRTRNDDSDACIRRVQNHRPKRGGPLLVRDDSQCGPLQRYQYATPPGRANQNTQLMTASVWMVLCNWERNWE